MDMDQAGEVFVDGGRKAAEDSLSMLRELHALFAEKNELRLKNIPFFKHQWATVLGARRQAESSTLTREELEATNSRVTRFQKGLTTFAVHVMTQQHHQGVEMKEVKEDVREIGEEVERQGEDVAMLNKRYHELASNVEALKEDKQMLAETVAVLLEERRALRAGDGQGELQVCVFC
jgi:hypothetical protein